MSEILVWYFRGHHIGSVAELDEKVSHHVRSAGRMNRAGLVGELCLNTEKNVPDGLLSRGRLLTLSV